MTGKEEGPESLGKLLRKLAERSDGLSAAERSRFLELVNESGHDFKNSLSRIIGANALLIRLGKKMEGQDGETIREMTEIIERAVKELDGQINEIIQYLQ